MSKQNQKQLVLASASPRREQLLQQIGLDFIVHPSDFQEKQQPEPGETPAEFAIYNALGKAQKVASHYQNAIIIGVDTVVSFQEHLLGKPRDPEHAKEMLRLLSGTTHQVISGIALLDTDRYRAHRIDNQIVTAAETTDVTMERLDETDIDRYVASGEGTDKAAGYAIQGLGSLYIEKISGDYFNVVGLPIHLLRKLLRKMSINI